MIVEIITAIGMLLLITISVVRAEQMINSEGEEDVK